jgi:hypothetical protein
MKWEIAAQGTAQTTRITGWGRGALMKVDAVEEKVLTTRGSGG